MSSEGNRIMVKKILTMLIEVEWEPNSLHWKSLPHEFVDDSPYDPVSLDGETTLSTANLNLHWKIE